MDLTSIWQKCIDRLSTINTEEFNIWIRPLQIEFDHNQLLLFAPNHFVMDRVRERSLADQITLTKYSSFLQARSA